MSEAKSASDQEQGSSDEELQGAPRRTQLASERTELAWWRTGMTALAVALAVGRVIPDLGNSGARWPYATAGVGFALYGAALIAYGSWRSAEFERELDSGGTDRGRSALLGLAAFGIVLSLATVALVLVD